MSAEKKYLRELRRITQGIPTELLENLMTTEIIAPTAKKLFSKALTMDTITPEQRERFQILLDSGVLDQEVEVVNFDTEKLIDAYLSAEIDLAVKTGRLPKTAPEWDYLKNKGLKYARKQQKRLKELFDTSGDTAENAEGDTGTDTISDSARESDVGVLPEASEQAS